MDALFVVVAELLIVPLILWALIVLELTVGVAASITAVVLGRRSPGEVVSHAWGSVRRRLLWSLIFLTTGLLLADLVFFEALVNLAVAEADERDDLDVQFAHAEGSFILGRIELHQLALSGEQGTDTGDPSARYGVAIDTLVIDVDTKALLLADFAVEELALDGVTGSFDRLRAAAPEPEDRGAGLELAREFSVQRLHVGDMAVTLRDHTHEPAREFAIEIVELDIGPIDSETALFDLLYRTRGRGSVAGQGFELTALEQGGVARTTLEVRDLSLDGLGEQLEAAAGIRASGTADLTIVDTYSEGPPEPKVELAIALQLHDLKLEAGAEASYGTKLMLGAASQALAGLGDNFPVEIEITLLRSELEGLRSLADSGVIERVTDEIVSALRAQLRRREPAPD